MTHITGTGGNPQEAAAAQQTDQRPNGREATQGRGLGDMDSEAFLELLVTQLRHQDPMGGGQEDTNEFVTQVTMLSLMEQVLQLQDSMENQEEHSQNSQMLSLLNQEVELQDENGETVQGTVTSVDMGAGKVTVNQESYPLSSIETVGILEEGE